MCEFVLLEAEPKKRKKKAGGPGPYGPTLTFFINVNATLQS